MNQAIKKAFKEVELSKHRLQLSLENSNYEGRPESYAAAFDHLKSLERFLDVLEEYDNNLDLDKTNLPNLDEIFAEDPVTDYVNAAIEYAQSQGSEEAEKKLKETALKVAESQKEKQSKKDLIDHIDSVEESYAIAVMENMELIEKELEGKTEFSLADLYLIRYYLKHKPYNSDYDVDRLSDRGLILAYKRIQSHKKNR